MTLAAHDRALLIFKVTALAVDMERLSQARLSAGTIFLMALGAALVLGRLIFQFVSVFINMMAFVAFLYFSQFIVFIMSEDSRRAMLC
jgi:hypothetical protein